MLVDTGFMREGIFTDDGLVSLDLDSREIGDQAAGAPELLGVDAGFDLVDILAHLEGHDDLLERGVPGALPDTVDGALDLVTAGLHGRERVGHSDTEVVVAVDAEHDVVARRHLLLHVAHPLPDLNGHGIADRVGDIDGRGPCIDRGLDHIAHEIHVAAGCVFGRELDVIGELAGQLNAVYRHLQDLFPAHLELLVHVEITGGDKDMDAGAGSLLEGLPCGFDVFFSSPGKAADCRPIEALGNQLDALEISRAGDREAGLDDIYPETLKLAGDHKFFFHVQAGAGTLFAVSQGRVENLYLSHDLRTPVYPVLFSCVLLPAEVENSKKKHPRAFRRRRVVNSYLAFLRSTRPANKQDQKQNTKQG